MDSKNKHALAIAFKRAKAKIGKVLELKITPDMEQSQINKLAIKLAKKKAKAEDKNYTDLIKGQQWYIETLVRFSSLEPKKALENEYNDVIGFIAEEAELINQLEKAYGN